MADTGRMLQGLSMMTTGLGNAATGYAQIQQKRAYYDLMKQQEERVALQNEFNQRMAQQRYDQDIQEFNQRKTEFDANQRRYADTEQLNIAKTMGGFDPMLGAEYLGRYVDNRQSNSNVPQSNLPQTGLGRILGGLSDIFRPNQVEIQQQQNAANQLGIPPAVETPAFQSNYTSRLSQAAKDQIEQKQYKELFPLVEKSFKGYADNSKLALSEIGTKLDNTTKSDYYTVPDGQKFNYIEVQRQDEPELFNSLEKSWIPNNTSPKYGTSVYVNSRYLEQYKVVRLRSAVANKVANIFGGGKLNKADIDILRQMDDIPVNPEWDIDEIFKMKSDKLARMVVDYARDISDGKVAVQKDPETGILMPLKEWQTKASYQIMTAEEKQMFDAAVRDGKISQADLKRMK